MVPLWVEVGPFWSPVIGLGEAIPARLGQRPDGRVARVTPRAEPLDEERLTFQQMADACIAGGLRVIDVRLAVPLQEVDRFRSAAGDLVETVGHLLLGQPGRAIALRRLSLDPDRLPGRLWLAG